MPQINSKQPGMPGCLLYGLFAKFYGVARRKENDGTHLLVIILHRCSLISKYQIMHSVL